MSTLENEQMPTPARDGQESSVRLGRAPELRLMKSSYYAKDYALASAMQCYEVDGDAFLLLFTVGNALKGGRYPNAVRKARACRRKYYRSGDAAHLVRAARLLLEAID
jgi:hypothetical protein